MSSWGYRNQPSASGDDGGLKVQEIDAYWLQRRISQSMANLDAGATQRLAQEVFDALQVCHGFISRGLPETKVSCSHQTDPLHLC